MVDKSVFNPQDASPAVGVDEELPGYSATASTPTPTRHDRTVHEYQLAGGGLKLTLYSRATLPKHVPYIMSGDPVVGTVELLLEKPDYFCGIEINLTGTLIGDMMSRQRVAMQELDNAVSKPFLEVSSTLWKATVPTTKPSLFNRVMQRDGERIEGSRKFEFSLTIPKTAEYKEGFPDGTKEFALPASFMEPSARGSVLYRFAVTVKRGRLNADKYLTTDIAFCPSVRPGPFSLLRTAAYKQGMANIPGPDDDQEGWETLPPVYIRGDLFGARFIEVECQLSLAKPLSYTRGTIVPCSILISTSDTQALDLLATPSAIVLSLVCNMYARSAKHEKREANSKRPHREPSTFEIDKRHLQRAQWWPAPESHLDGTRRLMGEIHVSPGLKPAMLTPEFKTYYTVCLYAFDAPGFVPTSGAKAADGQVPPAHDNDVLQLVPVEIATMHPAGGVRPKSVTPPSYEQPGRWMNDDILLNAFWM